MAAIVERKVILCPQDCGAKGLLTVWSCDCQGYTFVSAATRVSCSAHEELRDFDEYRKKCGQLGWAGNHNTESGKETIKKE